MFVYKQGYSIERNKNSWIYKYMQPVESFVIKDLNPYITRCELDESSFQRGDGNYVVRANEISVYFINPERGVKLLKKTAMAIANYSNQVVFDDIPGCEYVRSGLVEFAAGNCENVNKLRKIVKKFFFVPSYYATADPLDYAMRMINLFGYSIARTVYPWNEVDAKVADFYRPIASFITGQPEEDWTDYVLEDR